MKSLSFLLLSVSLCGSATAAIVSFDFGANDANTTVNSPFGSIAGSAFNKVNGVADVTGLSTTYGDLNLNLRRGNNNYSELTVTWGVAATAVNAITPPSGSILAESAGVYGDFTRNGDGGRTFGLRLNGLAAGSYEFFVTVNPASTSTVNMDGRNAAIGVFSGTMPTSTSISDLSQVSSASWVNYTANLASWAPSDSNTNWNVLRAVVAVSGPTDWVVVHLENAIANTASANQMGISSLQLQAIPEPSTYAALIGLLALGFVTWRRRR